MSSSRLALSVTCLMAVAMIHITQAQNSPKDFLDPHNSARADVGVGPMTWNNTVAAYVQNAADEGKADCRFDLSNETYSENFFLGSGGNAKDAVKSWVSEKKYYDYRTNTCNGGACLGYTQVVWAKSVYLGCARVVCNNGFIFIICGYYPRGNILGERPY